MNQPPPDTRWMEVLLILLALTGLVGTGAQLPAYLPLGPVGGTIQFWKDALVSPASIFLVVDIFVLGTAVFLWMFGECRRLGIAAAWVWVYFFGSLFIAISFFVPVFMAHRLRRIRAQLPEQQSAPAGSDFIGVAIALALVGASAIYSFAHMPA